MLPPRKFRLIYDGSCGFCRRWIGRVRRLTGGRVDFIPSQECRAEECGISEAEFAHAIQGIDSEGHRTAGAPALLSALATCGGSAGVPLALYRRIPLFARIADTAYRTVAAHRGFLSRAPRWLAFGAGLLLLAVLVRLLARHAQTPPSSQEACDDGQSGIGCHPSCRRTSMKRFPPKRAGG